MGCNELTNIAISINNYDRLCKLFDKWSSDGNSVMTMDDENYMIAKLLDIAEAKKDENI